ncbi:MAG TPA: MnhB domain-containing protein [Bacteroidota bacterium]|nr:MnhB domain-containing protein [Bacteroidota bacterium]
MTYPSGSPIIIVIGRLVAPFIQVFGLYIIFHGHYGPGGGFQGGAMLAASFLLMRLCVGEDASQYLFPRRRGTPVGILGASIFFLVGLVALALGGEFLNYAFLPFEGLSRAELRSMGILLVELGIGIAVAATLLAIFDDLLMSRRDDA